MKKTSKFLALLLSCSMTLALAACGGGAKETPAPSEAPAESAAAESAASGEATIAMITDKGDINDKSFNQGTWEGIQAYCEANGKECKYYKPVEATTDAYTAMIEQAINDGHKIIVTPGFLFEEPIYNVQDKYPDVSFILIDGNPHNADYSDYKTADNTVGILFSEEQVGYLAGYAAVKDGYTKLGFLGGQAVPAVVRYGYGFVQGADAAAAEMGTKVDMMYYYTGGFDATPEAQALAAGWYQAGTEVIFGCGGSVGNSAMAAAEQNNGKVIGVDVDQSPESATVISSAMKGLAEAVSQMLDAYYAGSFPGGQNLTLGAKEEAVKLPMDTSKWTTFTQADYDALYAQLADGTITLKKDTDAEAPMDLGCANVTVQFIEQ
ncbi:BMP family ABC transporter substrate-binding protein [Candidatus Pseudoscillospira sp. SGI.172]|uniref:BMP family lipoprotein n=1 Tax=Candidatus Pseudoscillospira sp. SGI.172 TaxID=3420582 RepID=UPI0009BA37D2|nr:BMP family ABC transporter substrate-binding protein [Pseudoflavonifractor sp.]MDY3020554.1 BMP family ABC transporter substrate-binding protein [Oscillospiraceae bacterium]